MQLSMHYERLMRAMSEEMLDEIDAINSIYAKDTLTNCGRPSTYILALPNHEIRFRLLFPENYPDAGPSLEGVESLGSDTPKGFGTSALQMADGLLKDIFRPGSVCMYDLIEDLEARLNNDAQPEKSKVDDAEAPRAGQEDTPAATSGDYEVPKWTVSQPFIEKHSTFIARASSVTSADAAQQAIEHLLSHDRKAAKATHNITAFRIRDPRNPAVTYQDCDDDGENAAGGRLLHLLQIMDVWDCLVVVSRWYGGVKLGPDRFRLINQAARDAIVGWRATRAKSSGGK